MTVPAGRGRLGGARQAAAGSRARDGVLAGRAPLVIGVGNPHRGDDGAGPAAAERAGAHPRLAGATVRSVVQLTPELAADLAGASVAVVVDATCGAEPGRVMWSEVAPRSGERAPLTHHGAPEALVALASLAYDRVPPTFVVSIGAGAFEPGAALSRRMGDAVAEAVDLVVALVERWGGDDARNPGPRARLHAADGDDP